MEKCFIPACVAEGTNFRDFTCGPLGDFRWYCDGHVADADAEALRRFNENAVAFQRARITALENQLAQARQRLTEYESKLTA